MAEESKSWDKTVRKAFRELGKGVKEWWKTPSEDPLPPRFQERLGKDISMLDLFPGGSGVGALTRKAAIGQAARGWRAYLKGVATTQVKGDPQARATMTALKTERKEVVQAINKLRVATPESKRILIRPRKGRAKAGFAATGKWFGTTVYYPGKAPGKELAERSPLEVIAHEWLGHQQALNPKKAGPFKEAFRKMNRALLKKERKPHETFAYRIGELTERYHKMKSAPLTPEDVKLLTEMASSEASWTANLTPFLRPAGR